MGRAPLLQMGSRWGVRIWCGPVWWCPLPCSALNSLNLFLPSPSCPGSLSMGCNNPFFDPSLYCALTPHSGGQASQCHSLPYTHTFCDWVRDKWKPFCMCDRPRDSVVEGWSWGSLLAEVEGCSLYLPSLASSSGSPSSEEHRPPEQVWGRHTPFRLNPRMCSFTFRVPR